MKFRVLVCFFAVIWSASAQKPPSRYYFSADVFRGNILRHTGEVTHLITGHPDGVLLSASRRSSGQHEWERAYNLPDVGLSFQYQDFKNEHLGQAYAIGAHYNFYFWQRRLMFRISQGIGWATNPYDKHTNYKNNAFGSRLMSSNLFMLQYRKERVFGPVGLEAGVVFTHFSNGRIKSPNSGINTYGATIGLNYDFGKPLPEAVVDSVFADFKEPFRLSLYVRSGVNESQITGSGQKPFYHFSVAVDKRLGRKSAIQIGADWFVSKYLEEFIRYSSVAYPQRNPIDPDTDYKRLGVFIGHELFINRLSIETQFGYYAYKPFDYEMDFYQRAGLKYYIYKNLFTGVALKTHGGRAEAIEFGVGTRL